MENTLICLAYGVFPRELSPLQQMCFTDIFPTEILLTQSRDLLEKGIRFEKHNFPYFLADGRLY